MFGIPINKLTGLVVPLDDILHSLFRHFERLRDLRSFPARLAALGRVMQTAAEQANGEDPVVSFAVREFERGGAQATVRDIADRVGLSSRQLERRFMAGVGIPPKLFGRMQRFQRVFQTMEGPHSDWVNAAVRCGYYDQAHLIRDFREFSGKTPTVLLSEEIDLSRKFARYRLMSRSSKTSVDRLL